MKRRKHHSPRGLDVEPGRFDARPVLTECDVREEYIHPRGGEEVFPQHGHELRLVARLHPREVLEELEVDTQPRHGRHVTEVHVLALELLDDAFDACLNLHGEKQRNVKPCSYVTFSFAFASNVRNGIYGSKWLCSHLMSAFSRKGCQRLKESENFIDISPRFIGNSFRFCCHFR